MRALDSGLLFAALPRVRPGLAELRPRRSSLKHLANRAAIQDRGGSCFALRLDARRQTSTDA